MAKVYEGKMGQQYLISSQTEWTSFRNASGLKNSPP